MEQITVRISSVGEIEYDVKGVKGAKCKDLTRLIDALGFVKETKTTGEYCQIDAQQHLNQGK